MYSNNDFRSYQELYHAEEKKKAKWPWLPGGKNTPEYNHWYYMTHPEKWGITKAGQQAVDAVKKGVDDFTNWTETDLDNKAVDALSKGYNKAKTAVTNTNAYKNAKNVASDVRSSTEAMQRRDDANRTANKAASAAESYREKAKTSTGADKQRYTRLAKQAEETEKRNRSQAGQESVNAKGYATRARNTAKSAVTNTADMYKNAIGSAVGNAVDSAKNTVKRAQNKAPKTVGQAVNRFVDWTDSDVDNRIRNAYRFARSGNMGAAKVALKDAGKTAVSETKNKIGEVKNTLGKAVDTVGNTVSKVKNAAEAYDAYRDYEKLRNTKDADRRELAAAKSRFERESKDEGGEIGVRAGDARNNLINTAKVAKANTQNMVGTAKNNSIIAAQRASKSVKDIYDKAMKELGDIRDKYGQNSPQYLQAIEKVQRDAENAIDLSGSRLRAEFKNAPDTVTSAMSNGLEWLDNAFDGLFESVEKEILSKNKYAQGAKRRESNQD